MSDNAPVAYRFDWDCAQKREKGKMKDEPDADDSLTENPKRSNYREPHVKAHLLNSRMSTITEYPRRRTECVNACWPVYPR